MRTPCLLSVAAVGLFANVSCIKAPNVTAPLPPGNNVLFIGNSLTYTNDLPQMVAMLARAAGVSLSARSLAAPDHALIDFLIDGSAQRMISGGTWKHIVLQQGPTTLPICRDTLVLAVRAINQLGASIGASSIVMMSWPDVSRLPDYPKVHESAQMAAITANAKFAPAGDAWQLASQSDPTLEFYGPDGYHPSPLGTYLAALVLFEQITGLDARTLPTDSPSIIGVPTLSQATMLLLQNAAHTANANAFAIPVPAWAPATPPSPGIRC
ncbi:MAG: hypothetical protein U0132_08595 [Gemmatimonadaceae bacterium]